jgi:transcription initiation factor TFIID subunit 4
VTMPGVGRPQQTLVNSTMMIGQPGAGTIRVQGPGIGTVRPAPSVQMSAGQNIVISQPGVRPGTPGSQITVPLQTLQNLRPGQGIPTGQAGHLLVKTESGQYQILRVGTSTAPTGVPAAAPAGIMSHPAPQSIRPTMSTGISTTRCQSYYRLAVCWSDFKAEGN